MENELKVCGKCKRELPKNTDYYFKKKDTKDGFTRKCKECQGYEFSDKLTRIPQDGYKFCIKCDRELPTDIKYFPPDSMCRGGLRNVCRECGSDGHFMNDGYIPKEWWSKEKEELLVQVYPHYMNEELIEKFFPNETLKSLTDKAYKMGKINKTEETMRRWYDTHSQRMSGENAPNYGKHLSEETRRKISIGKSGKYKGENNYWFGRKRSEEQRLWLSNNKKKLEYWKGNKNPRHLNPLYGEQNGRWNGGIKYLYYDLRENIQEWKDESMMNCNYKCVLSGYWFDEIHHLVPFKNIVEELFQIINIEQRQTIGEYTLDERKILYYEIKELHKKYPLGICLCKDLHKLFHDNYGYMDTTEVMFSEFKKRYYNGEFDDILDDKLKSKEAIKRLDNLKQVV